jgi:hypothetical protein
MPKGSKKKKEEKTEDFEEDEDIEEENEESQKTSIQISTRVRDKLWRLKFRKTYDEFLWELCDLYEEQTKSE